ncbi:MAG: LPXTG cell wall anchor domain-containing protein, partial [Actinomycetota bacterium]
KSASAPGHNKDTDAKHDPSNPDGTYQGKSPSTPDQDGIGADHGIENNDKTGEGTDGNNGCGNDPDREDDNNGWCGKPPAPEVSPTETPTTTPTVSPSVPTQVLGNTIARPEVAAQGLAQTGQDMRLLIAAGIMVLAMGLGIRAIRKQPSA